MKRRVLLLFSIFTTSVLFSHEFWLHPDKFIYDWGERINVKFLVGENYEGENWKGDSSNINSLQLHLSDASDDLSDQIDSTSGDSLQFAMYDEGTYLLTYNSKNRFIELDAKKFLEYLKEDGLTNAIDYRATHSETDSVGKELYQRSVKTIFQVGKKITNVFKKQTKLPIDIIPVQNPYSLISADSATDLTFKIYFQDKPLADHTIKVWHRANNQTIMKEYTSNENGEISFPVINFGRWMVSTVNMIRLDKDAQAQWQSYWGSCTWGYE